jgi:cell division septation protein DedD
MPNNGKRGGGDRVLESRHLVLLFLSVVLLCGVFFTLGYVMGHTQYGGSVHAADAPAHTQPQPLTSSPKSKQPAPTTTADKGGWGSDDSAKTDDTGTNSAPEPKPETRVESKPTPKYVPAVTPAKPNAKNQPVAEKQPPKYNPPPSVNKNSIVLQVAAVKQQRDALEMADELQKKKFAAFVISQADGFYHVQVGPYPDKATAEAARKALEQAGFKAIIKR